MVRVTLAQATQFILAKNFLAEKQAGSLLHLLEALAGLPAEPPLTALLAAQQRVVTFRPEMLSQALAQKQVVRAPLVRSTVYLVPALDYPLWLAATVRQRNQAFNAEFRLWGLATNDPIEQLAATVLTLLKDQALSQALSLEEIAARLPAAAVTTLTQTSRGGRVSQTTSLELALRWLTAQGKVTLLNSPPDRRQEQHVYALFEQVYPEVEVTVLPGEAEAQQAVVRRYLAAFGPASEADISFWTGFGKSETARATNALSRETTLTMVQGLPGMQLCLKAQAEALRAAQPSAEPVVSILPADDPFVTAHRASRNRYFNDQTLQRQIFSSSGAAKPTLLIDGQIVGIWRLEAGQLRWRLLVAVDPAVVSRVEAEVERTAAFLREVGGPQPVTIKKEEME
ncbi:MAG TPA: winged helix DNA-binding domain-containing protein [Anaerolineae bacterium]|nr:winged helix DNA-binding domain-containing protein [Anaerolineae bacterium]HMR65888.1 winged helix DNA-binding domain-containing protein [Anaerolineae bacterium]